MNCPPYIFLCTHQPSPTWIWNRPRKQSILEWNLSPCSICLSLDSFASFFPWIYLRSYQSFCRKSHKFRWCHLRSRKKLWIFLFHHLAQCWRGTPRIAEYAYLAWTFSSCQSLVALHSKKEQSRENPQEFHIHCRLEELDMLHLDEPLPIWLVFNQVPYLPCTMLWWIHRSHKSSILYHIPLPWLRMTDQLDRNKSHLWDSYLGNV